MEKFILEIEQYAALRGIKPSTVLQKATGLSGTRWPLLKAGRAGLTLATVDKVRRYIAEHPAPGAPSSLEAS